MRLGIVAALLSMLVMGCGGGAGGSDPSQPKAPGELTYQRYCFSCHASGISGAPPAGNAEAWAPRLAQGEALLLQHTVEGLPAAGMPARGMCLQCTDQELLDAIHYMATPRP
jgi:cytochrome c5